MTGVLENRVVLKENDTFCASDDRGDFPEDDERGFGLYRQDCRFLSTYELRVNGETPILLSHSIDRAYVATFQMVNPELVGLDGQTIAQQTLSIRRSRFVHDGLHDRIGLQNCTARPIQVELELRFGADFQDIFAVRKYVAPQTLGRLTQPRKDRGQLIFGYEGLDHVRRQTRIVVNPMPTIHDDRVTMRLTLEAQEVFVCIVGIHAVLDGDFARIPDFDRALAGLEDTYDRWNEDSTGIRTDNELFDGALLWRNQQDLRVLADERPTGLLPTAGIPWYAVPFGRDALLTSLQTLSLNPDLAYGSLRYLAQEQGTAVDPDREEEPGKIMHEIRFGELAHLHQVPHTPYYGSVDATPLFLVLLVELLDWTGDVDLLTELWPHVEAALEWIDRYGDQDGDGFVEYAEHAPERKYNRSWGVRNQGWKDSAESLMSAAGRPAKLPAALVEVQGYVHQAKAGLARWCRRTGRTTLAQRLEEEVLVLRKRFNDRFWMPGAQYFAQALDGDKQQVPSLTSNPGHCLWSAIVEPQKAERVVARLTSPELFSGWGVRTLSKESPFYNPMSYHNGSVWPHDNSFIAHGLRRYGYGKEAERIARGVIQGCMRFSDDRIPELFCGFTRDLRFNSAPGEYLISCSPQAWGAGSLFHFVQTLLGVNADVLNGEIRIDPVPTELFHEVEVNGMRVADGTLDFSVRYDDEGTPQVSVNRRPAAIKSIRLGSG
jgi:glycogen debranching enzyme